MYVSGRKFWIVEECKTGISLRFCSAIEAAEMNSVAIMLPQDTQSFVYLNLYSIMYTARMKCQREPKWPRFADDIFVFIFLWKLATFWYDFH